MMQTLFNSNLFVRHSVGSEHQRNELIKEIYQYKQSTPNLGYTNPGCWRGETNLMHHEWIFNCLDDLLVEAVSYYKKEDVVFGQSATTKSNLRYWINVNDPQSRNVMHNHATAHFSAVYYAQAQNTGELRFINPAMTLSNIISTGPFTRDFYINPNDGDFILWPAWVPHEVEPNYSESTRINIAFDITLEHNV
jgi:uncharacterized protein (TIGR02466 family)